MSNMSYCRFQNTMSDLLDCWQWLCENDPDKLSADELNAFKRLVNIAHQIEINYWVEE